MKQFSCLITLTLLSFIIASGASHSIAYIPSVWPQPANMVVGDTSQPVPITSTGFSITLNDKYRAEITKGCSLTSPSRVLNDAVERYLCHLFFAFTSPLAADKESNSEFFDDQNKNNNNNNDNDNDNDNDNNNNNFGLAYSPFTNISIVVSSLTDSLNNETDESYTLNVLAALSPSASTVVLTAKSTFGALRGLESFSQLVYYNSSGDQQYYILANSISIQDAPRFPWRGLMIDSSRHYVSLTAIKRQIDAMSYNKFNIFHWHLSDAESFPVQSLKYPKLSGEGAYDPRAIYTLQQLAEIVDYAFLRGVRVVPEFDMPGHAAGWGFGYSFMVADCPETRASNLDLVAMNPASNETYSLIDGFLKEMSSIFTDNIVHLGGDEVDADCWFEDASILSWMSEKNFTTSLEVSIYFAHAVSSIGKAQGKNLMFWEEAFTDGVGIPTDSIVEVWRDQAVLQDVVSSGYKGVTSASWYLDRQVPDPPSEHYSFIDTWQDFYSADPYDGVTQDPKVLDNILGGEACAWGESQDGQNIDERIWPRTSAVAERLWSPQNVTDIDMASVRLSQFRCTSLARRGIHAGPLFSEYCALPYEI